jgi:hypothetical protein
VAFRLGVAYGERCAGQVKIIVDASNRCIKDPAVIEQKQGGEQSISG